MQQQNTVDEYINGGRRSDLMFQEISSIPPWTISPTHNITSIRDPHHHDPFFLRPTSSSYATFFHKTPPAMHLSYHASSSGLTPFGLRFELQKMSAQEIMDAKALAASKSHSEAERRRRERINSHLSKLRSILPNTTKMDKASLLAEVIQHVKDLKRRTSQISEKRLVPTEMDELIVDNGCDEDGKLVIRASMCCEDRSDLLPDLIKTLKSMRLRTLKAEISTMGGRFKNVIFISRDRDSDDEQQEMQQYSLSTIQEALRGVMEKASGHDSGSGNVKRQRTRINVLEDRHI